VNKESWLFAVGYASKMAERCNPPSIDVVLLTHTKKQLEHTSLAGHLGTGAKALVKGNRADLGNGVMLRHETLKTLGFSTRNTVVSAFYADDRILEMLDGQTGVTGIVAVPEFDGRMDAWLRRWNPVVHGLKREEAKSIIDDPVIERALGSITTHSNIAYSVLHPRDREFADEVFRILRAKGHELNPAKIKSWAIQHGWKPGGGDELAKVAAKVSGLKNKPRISSFHEPQARYDRWKSEE
jgi:hypothetical protein